MGIAPLAKEFQTYTLRSREVELIERIAMSFALYMIGLVLVVGGVAWALVTMGLTPIYVVIACVIILGLGMMSAVSRTRSKDSS
jgi:hypothetical protein